MWIKAKQCVTTMETEWTHELSAYSQAFVGKLWLWYSVWTEDCDKWSHLEGFMMIVINVAQRHYSSYIKSPITHRSPMILDCCGGVSRCCPRRCPLHMPWCTEGRLFCLSFRACLEPVGRPLWREGKDGGGTEKRGRENKRIKEGTKEGRKEGQNEN